MLQNLKKGALVAFLTVSCLLVLAGSAFAQTATPAEQVGTALTGAVNVAKEVIGDNMPLVFGIPIAFVAWNIGKRVLGRV